MRVRNSKNEIKALSNNDSEIKDKMNRLKSIPGVGNILTATTLSDVPELGQIEFAQLRSCSL